MWRILFSAALLWSSLAHDAEANTARELFRQARQAYGQGKRLAASKRFEDAIAAYQRALGLTLRAQREATSPAMKSRLHRVEVTILYIVAKTYEFNRQYARAEWSYRRCISRKPPAALLQKARRNLSALQPRLMATVVIRSSPPGALVLLRRLNGPRGRFGRTPFSMKLRYGRYSLQLQASGYKSLREQLVLRPSRRVERSFQMEPTAAVAARYPRLPPRPRRTRPPRWPRIMLWTSLATLAITGVAGGLLMGLAQGEYAAVMERIGQPQESLENIKTQRDRGFNMQVTGGVFLGLAVVAGGAAIVGFVLQRKQPARALPPKEPR